MKKKIIGLLFIALMVMVIVPQEAVRAENYIIEDTTHISINFVDLVWINVTREYIGDNIIRFGTIGSYIYVNFVLNTNQCVIAYTQLDNKPDKSFETWHEMNGNETISLNLINYDFYYNNTAFASYDLYDFTIDPLVWGSQSNPTYISLGYDYTETETITETTTQTDIYNETVTYTDIFNQTDVYNETVTESMTETYNEIITDWTVSTLVDMTEVTEYNTEYETVTINEYENDRQRTTIYQEIENDELSIGWLGLPLLVYVISIIIKRLKKPSNIVKAISSRICHACGNMNILQNFFCEECGAKL